MAIILNGKPAHFLPKPATQQQISLLGFPPEKQYGFKPENCLLHGQ